MCFSVMSDCLGDLCLDILFSPIFFQIHIIKFLSPLVVGVFFVLLYFSLLR